MQIQTGTVTVTLNSALVVGDANADWTDAQIALGFGTPVLFSLIGSLEILR